MTKPARGPSTLRTGTNRSRVTKGSAGSASQACTNNTRLTTPGGGKPEREEAALRPLAPPADAEAQSVVDHYAAQEHQHRGGELVENAHATS